MSYPLTVDGFKAALDDPEKLKLLGKELMRNEGFRLWGGFGTAAIIIFWMFSSGDFSFLLTLSSLVSLFSFLMVLITCEAAKSVQGVSLKMMECYVLVFSCRCVAIIPYEGYLPFDKSGDWLYQLCEAICLTLSGSIVFYCRQLCASTYNPTADNFPHVYIIGGAAVVALILHPHLNNAWFSDFCWAFALYLESVTVLPQLFMFMKEGRATPHTAHFLGAQALSRTLSFIFWASSFSELSNPNHYIRKFVGNWVVVIQLVQLFIMADFIYHYVRCIQRGISVSEVLSACNNV